MLRTLNIRDFVIVDALEIDFNAGFTVFSGETGTGKSILIDALALVLGERADASVVREGAVRAEITAEFIPGPIASRWLEDQELADEASLLLRRVIDAQGRSKSWINGSAATLSQMRAIGELLVDIHGQHAHQRLLKGSEQRRLLDEQGGLVAQGEEVKDAYTLWQKLREQRERFEVDAQQIQTERANLEWQAGELAQLSVEPGEWEEIQQEHQRLAHAQALIEGARWAVDGLSEADGAVLERIDLIEHRLTQLAAVDNQLNGALETLESARIHAQETARGLSDYLERIELDPERLASVEARIEAIHAAARKFRVPPGELSQLLGGITQRLAALEGVTDINTLRLREHTAQETFEKSAKRLSSLRASAARALEAAVTEGMQSLSMAGGKLVVDLAPCAPSAQGLESVEFQVATHPGMTPRPLSKVASGGELSRISLALSVIASTSKTVPTLIFDEVDSGIGGAVAEVVGRLLRQLGRQCQVLCVTHLAQVAAQAEHHFAVNKVEFEGRTLSQIQSLASSARIDELARMLGGIDITATTRKHARELLASVN